MGLTTGSKSQYPNLFQNCVLWWPGSHSSGYTSDIDEFPIVPSGVTATNNGTWTKTDLGNNKSVLNFDGISNYISLTTNSAWNFGSSNFTISFWYKPVSIVSGAICGHKWDNRSWIIYQYSDGKIEFDLSTIGSSGWSYTITSPIGSIVTTDWMFFTIVRSGSNVIIYKLGTSIASSNSVSGSLYSSSNPLQIGADIDTSTVYRINGNIKDLMIWNGKVLSQAEIKMLMIKTHPITGTGLMFGPQSYWRLS